MNLSITTRYIGPTNTRGSRCKASTSSGVSLTVSWDYSLSDDANHVAAAKALATKLGEGWHGHWAGAATRTGCVFVSLTGDEGFTVKI